MKQTAGHDALGEFAPEFAHLNDDVLFGEVWSREDKLSLKLRSIATISALIGKGITDSSLHYHLATARKNGVTEQEMAELLTHLAFYAGWPNAWAAFNQAKEVYAEDLKDPANAHGGMFGLGQPNDAYAQYFIGQSYLNVLSKPGDPLAISNVTFEPGCRNNWHIHRAASGGGQVLICVDGEGWYQEADKPAQSLKPGDVVEIPANVKHWHGAKQNSWFSHLAFGIPGTETSNEWLEPVDDEAYGKLD
ncbi:carboxymuconolactone decarboxylase family protein [Limosilactobacillus mucosae]|uniref:Carboxymuconolactone decarboxylase family protein n=1 Tax=Limosilactobacillus mucosae TaxID=97478 RepID=A0AAJ1M8Y7_LIMMU|nr:carboxymuconolactone decarboxylase family protein [Limosilactobacillus mucosae]MDC2828115.1 carboxymuconolactone decarboxylase family protein [Limosilactobacillus mucosae]MDC2835780.1 carboxymuconolactone decarboxylase family protein [Limosilactobacillus mucosae]